MPPKHVFLGQIVDAWQMISPLVRLHPLQKLHSDWAVEPAYVPLPILSLRQVVLEVELCHLLNHVIVRVLRVHGQTLCFPLDLVRVKLVLIVFLVT